MAIYQRHTPESTALYQTVARVWPGLRAEYAASDAPIAGHVETEFERYLRCGILQYGFVKLKCTACEQTRLLGFSCKRRGFIGQPGIAERDMHCNTRPPMAGALAHKQLRSLINFFVYTDAIVNLELKGQKRPHTDLTPRIKTAFRMNTWLEDCFLRKF